jgi:hypothetical protein
MCVGKCRVGVCCPGISIPNNQTSPNQFVQLWVLIQNVHLVEDVEDDIHWKLTSNGEYSTASAYNLQFFDLIESSFYKLI